MSVWEQTGKKPAPLEDLPECPPELVYIVDLWKQLAQGQDLSFQEIESFCRMRGFDLAGWEVDLLFTTRNIIHRVLHG
jgi:hypothetical protein